MLIILLDIIDDSPCHLHFRQQVEVPEYEKYFTILLEMLPHVVLEHEQVILVFFLLACTLRSGILDLILFVVVSIAEWENVISDLEDH
jgi:hypothetical protein